MSYLREVNKVASKIAREAIAEQVFRTSPILDFIKRNELESVYMRAQRYGYVYPYRDRLRVEGMVDL